jgi:predicted RNA-binding Zn ribbon-like protein
MLGNLLDPHTVLGFVNTRRDRPSGRVETLRDPAATTTWLADELGYAQPGPLSEAEHERIRAFRDSAQGLLRARLADGPPAPDDLLLLNRSSAAAPRSNQLHENWQTSSRFTGSGSADPHDLNELLAALASATISLAADPSGDLAECGADDCVVLFLRTDPRQRWHSERCGNRMRAARSYSKHKLNAQSQRSR